MIEVAQKQSLFSQWFGWHFFEVPSSILKAWGNFLRFNLNYFSIPLLLKTFFSHWHRYYWTYPRGFDIGKLLEVFFSNLVSRFLGALMRFFLIMLGLLMETFIAAGGIVIFFGWLVFPLALILGLGWGIKILIF